MARLLTLDASGAQAAAAIVDGDHVLAERIWPAAHGQSGPLAPMVAEVLAEAGVRAMALDGVAVIVGPGSFTGLRATLALAHGIALAAAIPIIGVTLAEAFAQAAPPPHGGVLWTAIDSRRGRVFLHDGEDFRAVALDRLTCDPGENIAVIGNAAAMVADALTARGRAVTLIRAGHASARDIARAAARRMTGALSPLAAVPLYIDPPEAKIPTVSVRPAPARGA